MTVTATPAFTPLPAAPRRLLDAPAVFVPKADVFADALVVAGPEIQAIGTAAEANATAAETAAATAEAAADAATGIGGYFGTSASSVNLATGSQSFTVAQAGLLFLATQQIVLILLSDDSVRVTGALTSYTAGTGAAVFTVTRFTGSGPSGAGWAVMLKALEGLSPEEVTRRAISFAIAL